MVLSDFKYGILIPVYDRVDYVKNTLHQLTHKTNSSIIEQTFFIIIDDGSIKQQEIYDTYINFNVPSKLFIRKPINKGISSSIRMGFDILYSMGIEFILNVDSDVNLEENWIDRIIELYNEINDTSIIVNGWFFPNIEEIDYHENFVLTKWMSGLSSFFHRTLYKKIRHELFENKDIIKLSNYHSYIDEDVKINSKYNQVHWDIALSQVFQDKEKKFVCCKPPCMEHIGRVGKNTRITYDVIKNDFKKFDYLI